MQEYQRFLNQFRTKRFKKGEIILCQGEMPQCVYVVKEGIVKSYNLTLLGEEKPIGFDIYQETFPLGWVYGEMKQVQYYYEAFVDCELYCIPLKDYKQFFAKNHKMLMSAFENLIRKYMAAQMRINALEQSKAPSKVINTIHYLCLRFGEDVRKNTVKIKLPMTQQDLANFIGLTRETTGIELKKLQQQGVLTYRKQNYIVRTDKLDALLDEDYNLGLKNDPPTLRLEP